MQEILKLSNISKKYNDTFAVKDLNLTLNQGEIYGFLGKNGAGKTTTIRMIMGLIKKTSGEIKFLNSKKSHLTEDFFKQTSATIEYPGFYLNLTAKENLLYYAKMRDIEDSKVTEMLDFFNLSPAKDKIVKGFSLGMKQRLSLARAMLNDPTLLILDEPTNGLDPSGIHEIRETIKNINKERNVTILFSSHILSEVELISKRIGIINYGNLIDEFSLEDFNNKNNSTLNLNVSDSEKTIKILNDLLKINNIYKHDNTSIDIKDFKNPHIINKVLVQNGIDVHRLFVNKETLEDRFLRLTGGKI